MQSNIYPPIINIVPVQLTQRENENFHRRLIKAQEHRLSVSTSGLRRAPADFLSSSPRRWSGSGENEKELALLRRGTEKQKDVKERRQQRWRETG